MHTNSFNLQVSPLTKHYQHFHCTKWETEAKRVAFRALAGRGDEQMNISDLQQMTLFVVQRMGWEMQEAV